MGGLSTAVNIAANGLKVTQTATALVSANVAGASTDGYTTKTLGTQALYADTGLVGFSTTVSRAFDQEVFDQLATSTGTSSYLDVKNTYVGQIESLVGSTSAGAALPTALSSFSSDLQTLVDQPSSSSAQIEVVNSASVVTQTLNSLSSSLSSISDAVDTSISDDVDSFNTLTSQIADLNKQIVSQKAQGADITGLEDTRDQAVLKLANLVDVDVKPQTDGSVRVSTSAGLTLVDGGTATQLQLDSSGAIRVSDANGIGADVISNGLVTSGELAGLAEVRDTILPQAQSQLDQIAAGLATALSETTTSGTTATSGSSTGFDIDAASLANSGGRLTVNYTDASGTTKTVSFVDSSGWTGSTLSDASTLDPDDTVVGIDFSAGMSSIVSQIQSALGSSVTVSNTSGSTLEIVGSTGSVNSVSKTLTATKDGEQSGTSALALFTDGTSSFTDASKLSGLAARIAVNSNVSSDPSLLVAYSSTTESADTTRPEALLAGLSDTEISFSLGNGLSSSKSTVASYADSMVSYWAGQSSTAQTLVDNQSVIQSNLQSRMSSTSAVDTDTEMTKLIQLQNYYSANAQVLSTLRDMLDTLVNSI